MADIHGNEEIEVWQDGGNPHPVGPKHGLHRKAGTPILGSLSAEGPEAGRNLKQNQGLEPGWL